MRLIDADVLKQHIDKLPALPDGNFAGNHSALKALINMQPTFEPSTNCSEVPNSSDAISRQAAIDTVEFGITHAKAINKSTGEVKELFKEGNKALNEAVERLKELPSAESELIWCKDCKHWYKDADSGMSCEYTEMSQPEDGFCNWAEWRGEEE